MCHHMLSNACRLVAARHFGIGYTTSGLQRRYLMVNCSHRMFSGGIKDDTLHPSQRRLIMRVKNTGMKELDVLFAGFMASIGEHMDARMLRQFHTMLDLDTPTLYRTFIVQQQLPEQLLDNVVAAKLLEYARSGNLTGVRC